MGPGHQTRPRDRLRAGLTQECVCVSKREGQPKCEAVPILGFLASGLELKEHPHSRPERPVEMGPEAASEDLWKWGWAMQEPVKSVAWSPSCVRQ